MSQPPPKHAIVYFCLNWMPATSVDSLPRCVLCPDREPRPRREARRSRRVCPCRLPSRSRPARAAWSSSPLPAGASPLSTSNAVYGSVGFQLTLESPALFAPRYWNVSKFIPLRNKPGRFRIVRDYVHWAFINNKVCNHCLLMFLDLTTFCKWHFRALLRFASRLSWFNKNAFQ